MTEKVKNDRAYSGQEYELAGLVQRLVANILDNFMLAIPIMIIQFIIFSSDPPLPFQLINFIVLAIPVFYYWFFWTKRDGQTPGKFAVGIRVIKTDGSPIGDVDAIIRAVGYHISAMLFGLGYIWAFFDKNNQTWHDKMARTYVVRTEEQRKTVVIDD